MQPCKNGNVSIKAEGLSHPIAPRSQGVGAIRNPVPVQVSQHILTHITVGSQPLWLHAHCRTHTLLHRPSFSFPQEQKPVPSCPKHSRGSCARTGAQGKQPFCVAVPLPTPPAPGMLSERRKTHSKRLSINQPYSPPGRKGLVPLQKQRSINTARALSPVKAALSHQQS